jgi:SAM-dependent methyltransferase
MLEHLEWSSSIGRLKAVDSRENVRESFAETIRDDRVTVADGSFTRTGVEDGWADLVVLAHVRHCFFCHQPSILPSQIIQALHRAPNFDAAMAENARILKPKGVLACIWNLDDRCDILRSLLSTFQRFLSAETLLHGLLSSASALNGSMFVQGFLRSGTAFGVKHSIRVRTTGPSTRPRKKSSGTSCLVPCINSNFVLSDIMPLYSQLTTCAQ